MQKSSPTKRSLMLASVAVALSIAAPAHAQDAGTRDTTKTPAPDQTPPTTAAPSTPSKPSPTPSSALPSAPASDAAPPPAGQPAGHADMLAEVKKFERFDALKEQGKTTDYPGAYETIDRDIGGFRSWLFDHDLYFKGTDSTTFAYDVGGGRRPVNPQAFQGQKFTAIHSTNLGLSWKIAGSGEDITQLNVGGTMTNTTWVLAGPGGIRMSDLTLYSSFLHRTIELKAGFDVNLFDFVGIFSGGNPILANGLSGSIPVEAGLSGANAYEPTFTIQLNGKNGLYSKTGVQRSVGPDGPIEEARANGFGLRLTRPGANPLVIQEFGVRRAASPDSRQIWLRAGGLYNFTRYTKLDGNGERRNWMAYALADYQLTQPSRKEPYKGIYIGGSALFAPDSINAFKQSYEARVYALGMIPGRPTDQMTITVDYNLYSRSGGDAIALTGIPTHRYQFSTGALYAFHVTHGLFVSPSVAYILHPNFTGDFKPAVNLTTSVAILF